MSRIPEMNDEDLGELLRTLPGARASAGFTGQVLSQLDERVSTAMSRAVAERKRRIFAAAAALVVGIGVTTWFGYDRWLGASDGRGTATRVERIRSEYREIQGEIQKLRELANELSPMLELGGNEELGFVFDIREPNATRQSETQPASLRREPGSY